jgi:hypothetical protein
VDRATGTARAPSIRHPIISLLTPKVVVWVVVCNEEEVGSERAAAAYWVTKAAKGAEAMKKSIVKHSGWVNLHEADIVCLLTQALCGRSQFPFAVLGLLTKPGLAPGFTPKSQGIGAT